MNFSRFLLPSVLGLMGLVSPQSAHAVPINVPNFSFESDITSDSNIIPLSTGWRGSSGDVNVYNPGSADYTGAGGNSTPSGANGANVLDIYEAGSAQSASSLTNVQLNTRYTLTVAVGNDLKYDPGNLRVGFLINDNFVPGSDTSFNGFGYANNGSFRDFSFSYQSTSADVGRGLKIYLGQTTAGGANIANFDNVRLDATAVATPEPSTYAMMALGLVALGVLGARRKKDEAAI